MEQTAQDIQKPQTQVQGEPKQEEPKKEPIFCVMEEKVFLDVIAFLKKLPWETSNDAIVYLDKNTKRVTLKQQEDEKDNQESSN